MLSIHDVMTPRPITAAPGTTIGELAWQFDRLNFNAIPVVDAGGVLLGIITKHDVLRALRPAPDVEVRTPQAIASQRIGTIMRRGVVAVEPEDPLVVAADLMLANRLRSIPVVQRSRGSARVVVGIVSQGDLLRGLRGGLVGAPAAAGLESPWEPS